MWIWSFVTGNKTDEKAADAKCPISGQSETELTKCPAPSAAKKQSNLAEEKAAPVEACTTKA